MILANIAKETIKKQGYRMTIPNPEIGTDDFYCGACGLIKHGYGYAIENQELKDFSTRKPKQR